MILKRSLLESRTSLSISIAFLTGIFCLTCYLFWVGVIGSDDWVYIQNARERLDVPFLIGMNHWDVRLTLTLPMAAAFFLWGESEFVAAMPTLLYTFALCSITFIYFHRCCENFAAVVITALVATSPLVVVNATALRIDAVEAFFVVASLLACLSALERDESGVTFFLSGILAGLAFLTRPTAAALMIFYILLFLVGFKAERTRYLSLGVGFLLVWVTESVYYGASTGNFFYRFNVDFGHDNVIRANNAIGAVIVEPVKMLLGSHSIGPVFWFLPLSAMYVSKCEAVTAEVRLRVFYLVTFVATWIVVFCVFSSKLVLDPRYITPAVVAALCVIGISIVTLLRQGRWIVFLISFSGIILLNMLALAVENKNFAYSQRWLADVAKRYSEQIYTDPQTYERAEFLLELEGVKQKITAGISPPGALFVSVKQNAERGFFNQARWNPSDYEVGDWQIIEKLEPGRTKIGRILEIIGVDGWIPESVWKKLDHPNAPIYLYRRPSSS